MDSPYKGLIPYAEEDAAYFFGRDDERRIIAANLRASRLTTSLLRRNPQSTYTGKKLPSFPDRIKSSGLGMRGDTEQNS